jgi:hypothetical protein
MCVCPPPLPPRARCTASCRRRTTHRWPTPPRRATHAPHRARETADVCVPAACLAPCGRGTWSSPTRGALYIARTAYCAMPGAVEGGGDRIAKCPRCVYVVDRVERMKHCTHVSLSAPAPRAGVVLSTQGTNPRDRRPRRHAHGFEISLPLSSSAQFGLVNTPSGTKQLPTRTGEPAQSQASSHHVYRAPQHLADPPPLGHTGSTRAQALA